MKDFKFLGLKVSDRVTGICGVVTAISYDLYGCVQAIVTPFVDKEGKLSDSRWFDTKRLEILDRNLVMAVPNFEDPPGGMRRS